VLYLVCDDFVFLSRGHARSPSQRLISFSLGGIAPFRTMRISALCLGLLCAYLAALILVVYYHLADDSVFAYRDRLWAGYSSLIFLFYGLAQFRSSRPNLRRYFSVFGRALLILMLAAAFGTLLNLSLNPTDLSLWHLTTFGILIPAVPAALIALTVAFSFCLLRRRAT
jgi:hypothetical protein